MSFDLFLRSYHVVTKSEVSNAYIVIGKGQSVALAEEMVAGSGTPEIDAADRLVTPRSIDSHWLIDQLMPPPMRTTADFDKRKCICVTE